jgi:hypothetical protein
LFFVCFIKRGPSLWSNFFYKIIELTTTFYFGSKSVHIYISKWCFFKEKKQAERSPKFYISFTERHQGYCYYAHIFQIDPYKNFPVVTRLQLQHFVAASFVKTRRTREG